ncbi:hypothetical protein Tco_1428005 [Tanacetum coccineum]
MADLTFADSHNMVAFLEKSEDNADFVEIVNFLNASPISGPTTLVADKTVHEKRGDSVERTATTAASLDAERNSDASNKENVIDQEERISCFKRMHRLWELCAPITTAGIYVSTVEPGTPLTTTTTLIKDEDLTIAQTLMKMR